MQPSWIITSVAVPLLCSIGGALMFGPSAATHWAACAAFLSSGIWIGVMGMMWFRQAQTRDWMWMAAIVAYVFVFTPMMIYFAWPAVAQAPPPGGVSGNCNNFGNNNFNCNTLNLSPPRATFSDELGAQLLAHMPEKKKSVALQTVGGTADQKVGDAFQKFLEDHGFAVQRAKIGVRVPPPDHPFTFSDTQNAYSIVVAPSAH
jgi:hypothetical protein